MSLKVNQCCCGFSLQSGTVIIGWLYLIGGLLQMLRIAMMLMPDVLRYRETNILIGLMVGSVVWNAVNIMLLFSAHQNSRPGLILPWLICKAVLVLLLLVGTGLGLFLSIISLTVFQDDRPVAFGILCFSAFGSALTIYFWSVIYSYYHQLKEDLSSTKETLDYSKFNSSSDV